MVSIFLEVDLSPISLRLRRVTLLTPSVTAARINFQNAAEVVDFCLIRPKRGEFGTAIDVDPRERGRAAGRGSGRPRAGPRPDARPSLTGATLSILRLPAVIASGIPSDPEEPTCPASCGKQSRMPTTTRPPPAISRSSPPPTWCARP